MTEFKLSPAPMRINDVVSEARRSVHRINPFQKYTFKFISDTLPDVRSLFYIKGKKYVCEKITASFSDLGMSEMLKGDFYPVIDG